MTYNINDEEFKNSNIYKEFIKNNPAKGFLRVRAYAASGAIPMKDVKIIVSSPIEDDKVIFFEGVTNESGTIDKIELPAPSLSDSNLTIPPSKEYDIEATYPPDNIDYLFKISIYEDICVVQTINIIPNPNIEGETNGG